MNNNFTPLQIKDEGGGNKKIISLFEKISFFIFVGSFLFFLINVFIPNFLNYLNKRTRAENKVRTKIYIPNFKTIEEINFIPKKINNIHLDTEKIYQYYKNKYSSLDQDQLIKLINEKIFSFIVVSDESNLDLLTNFVGDLFDQENEKRVGQYQKNVKKIDFYYFKVRFVGTREENLEKLNVEDVLSLAKEKIDYYYQLKISPSQLMEIMKNDSQISLLNNKEPASERIENYSYSTPIFDDPDFYQLLINSPIGTYSEIYKFKTPDPLNQDYEEYCFIFFFVEKIEGENLPLNLKINEFIKKSKVI